MSDAMSAAYKAARKEDDYRKRLQFIWNSSLEDVCKFYNIDKTDDVLQFSNIDDFTLERKTDFYGEVRFVLSIRIPTAYSWTEQFEGSNFEQIATRCKAYLQWANTDLGKKAIKRYLD